jgi:GAF domain-containing protein
VCLALAAGPLAVALLTEGRWTTGGPRITLLLALGLCLALGAVRLLGAGDARRAREAAGPERALRQARDQQAATSEILGAMAASPPDLQRVLDTIARNAVRVSDGLFGNVYRIDGDEIRLAAHHGLSPGRIEALARHSPRSIDAEGVTAQAIRTASVVHCPDILTDPRFPAWGRQIARAEGFRSMVVVPMMQGGRVLGTLNVSRPEGAFTERQIELLRAFAAQAVIAIENVRLFTELGARNRELTESLEQQTATAEILGVISRSPTDTQPVFDGIVASAVRLCDARIGAIYRIERGSIDVVATADLNDEARRAHRLTYPMPVSDMQIPFQGVVSTAELLHVVDIDAAPGFSDAFRARARALGYRSALAVPMCRDGRVIGLISVGRIGAGGVPRPFSDREIGLLRTFADQAVIAIENVRLFQELEARNRELTESLEQQTATAEILGVISRSPTDLAPVLEAVARSASRLCGAANVSLYQVEGRLMRKVAEEGPPLTMLRVGETRPVTRTSISGRAIADRTTIHVPDYQSEEIAREYPDVRRDTGIRTTIGIPLLRDGEAIGTFTVYRTELRPFSERESTLLRTFADQAVIAIENARLFQELGARNRELTEALGQQTATSEILRVISSSPTDTQPVFETIARNAVRLCDAVYCAVFQVEGGRIDLVAHHNIPPEGVELLRQLYPAPVTTTTRAAWTARERVVLQIDDIERDPATTEAARRLARIVGYRSQAFVPMLKGDQTLGVLTLSRRETGPFAEQHIELLRTFADQAVIAIENVRLFRELEARNRELTESLEQQTATAEILRAISGSPTDTQPVFDIIAERAVRLCDADLSAVSRCDGELINLVALHGIHPEAIEPVRRAFPMTVDDETGTARAVRTRSITEIPDILADPAYQHKDVARVARYRSGVGVPMVREGEVIGVIFVARADPGRFPDKQIQLVQTFADQAVIAIENVRLFRELEARNRELTESLEQQTATAEILGVIGRSPRNTQPVFEAIVRSASRLLGGAWTALIVVDGDLLHVAAYQLQGMPDDAVRGWLSTWPRSLDDESGTAVAIRTGQTLAMADAQTDPRSTAAGRATAVAAGYRCFATMPMLKDGRGVGGINVARPTVGPFTDRELSLLQIFADQAVIAIENVRLFRELEARNRELTQSLEQQTATAEILQVISGSPTDIQPVFETIARSATTLCEGDLSGVYTFDGELIHIGSLYGRTPEEMSAAHRAFPQPPSRLSVTARAILTAAPVQVPDHSEDPDVADSLRIYRTVLAVPMIGEGRPIGAISVARRVVKPFTDQQIALLRTFADQGVIAIKNVRLFQELQARTRELARSVEELQALSEVGRAVSSTLDLPTVLATIVARAVQLSGTSSGVLYEYDEATQTFHLQASHQTEAEVVEALRASPIQLGEGATGRAVARRAPVEVVDLLEDQQFKVGLRTVLTRLGYRSILSIPLLLEHRILGALTVSRREPGHFPPETVNLLQTFATQSALAIQNARLFREIEAKGRELEIASRHKSQFLANMSHELRTPLNAILGYTELLIDGIYGELSAKAGDVMARIDRSGKHLLGLINDVLDLSKIEAGQLELGLADYSLAEVVNAVVTQVESLAAEKGLILHATVAPDLPPGRGDERRLAQVLLNLVGNALKFTEFGSVRIVAHRDGDAFVVSVADTGPGIAEGDRRRIFEEFQQADNSSTRKKGGTGLGLSIARRIVELHGGRIWVESTVGRGSVFSFRVPVRVERQAARA